MGGVGKGGGGIGGGAVEKDYKIERDINGSKRGWYIRKNVSTC